MEEEKWAKVMRFLRANPNLLLKLVPTTMAVDEQGVEQIQRYNRNLNRDLKSVQKPPRVKSAGKKKRPPKSIEKEVKEEPKINKSQVLASSNNPPVTNKVTGLDETFYSDSRSFINKSNVNISVFGNNDALLNEKSKYLKNLNMLADQLPGVNLPQYLFKSNALAKADSVYSSNNVPIIRDFKTKKARPMSMKHPRKLRQKIDEKYLNNHDVSQYNPSMPTVWNSKNQHGFVQIPFQNAPFNQDNSFMSNTNIKSPEFSQNKFDSEQENFKERMGIHSPSAVLDLTKPVLSLRNKVKKESIQHHYITNVKKLKIAAHEQKRGSTMAAFGNSSVVSEHVHHKRVRTREEKRPKRNQDLHREKTLSGSKSKTPGQSKSPSVSRPKSKDRSVRIRKRKKSKATLKAAKRAQAGSLEELLEDSVRQRKTPSKGKNRKSIASNKSFKINQKTGNKLSGFSPQRLPYPQIHEPSELGENYGTATPINFDMGGIFNMNLNEESAIDPQEFGINIRSNPSQFDGTSQKPHKVPIIDWAESQIFQMVLDGDIQLNKENSNKFFEKEEIDYIVHMMKKRYKDFKTTEMLSPFFKKGKNTLHMLMYSLDIGEVYERVDANYAEVTLEN